MDVSEDSAASVWSRPVKFANEHIRPCVFNLRQTQKGQSALRQGWQRRATSCRRVQAPACYVTPASTTDTLEMGRVHVSAWSARVQGGQPAHAFQRGFLLHLFLFHSIRHLLQIKGLKQKEERTFLWAGVLLFWLRRWKGETNNPSQLWGRRAENMWPELHAETLAAITPLTPPLICIRSLERANLLKCHQNPGWVTYLHVSHL